MSVFTSKQERIRFLKFAFVGVTGTIVDFGIMNLLRLAANMPLIWAQAISFAIAVVNNFLWNRYWTYPESRSKTPQRQFLQFALINVVGILIRTPLVTWFDKIILAQLDKRALNLPLENYIISQNLALVLTVGIVMLWNYFSNRYWTYSDLPKEVPPQTPEVAPAKEKEQ